MFTSRTFTGVWDEGYKGFAAAGRNPPFPGRFIRVMLSYSGGWLWLFYGLFQTRLPGIAGGVFGGY
jgi:hypothetical protein